MFDNKKQTSTYELVILSKDSQGNPTGKKRSFYSNDGPTMAKQWHDNNCIPKKTKKKKVAPATTQKEIAEGLQEVAGYTERIRKERKLED